MGFKRPIMIAGGTVGAIAAVLGYHPAQSSTGLLTQNAPLGSSTGSNAQSAATPAASASATAAAQTPSAAPSSSSATASATKKNKSKQSSTNSGSAANATASNMQPAPQPSASQSQSQAPAQTTTPPPPAPAPTKTAGAPQTITGPVISTRWGPVQVEIVVDNGQIVSATGLQYPNGDRRSSYISQQAIPLLVDLTLQAQSASGMQGVGGATYTSNGWKSSLAAALRNI